MSGLFRDRYVGPVLAVAGAALGAVETLAPATAAALKIAYGAVLAAIVTPIGLRRALARN